MIGSGEGAKALENSNFVYNGTPSIDDFNGSTESWSKELEIDNSFSGATGSAETFRSTLLQSQRKLNISEPSGLIFHMA